MHRRGWIVRAVIVVGLTGGCASDLPVLPGEETTDGESGSSSTGALDTGGGETQDPGIDTDGGGTEDTGIDAGCGNGIVEAGETCDEQGQTATCDEDCTPVDCGDGLLNEVAGEQCDTGGASETCNLDCSLPRCGDGMINVEGEQCDDAGRTGMCDLDCTLAECGDGFTNVTADESCDDAGESVTCDLDCTLVECGDGTTNVIAGEICDAAGASAECDEDCTLVECGDAIVNTPAGESCDSTELAGGTCEGLGFGVGTLWCNDGCGYETSGCAPGTPILDLSFSEVKRFDFSWAAVQGAEYYQVLESPALGEPYGQLGGSVVGESVSFEMPLHLRWQASYVLRACNAAGCTDSAAVDIVASMVEAIGYLKASNTDADDGFGWSLALSGDGNTLAVGAIGEDSSATGIDGGQADDSASYAGAVYVLVRDGLGSWSQQAYVKASNTDAGDYFGTSVALSEDGNTLAVGATGEDSNATGIGGNQASNISSYPGAAYVFIRDGAGTWSQQAYMKASNTGADDQFGTSVALSENGSTLAVSAPGEASIATGIGGNQADNSAFSAGAAYVFVRNGAGVWSQQAYVKSSNTATEDAFGWRLALSGDGNTLSVSAWQEDSNATGIGGNQADNSALAAGAVYVFARNGAGVWSQQAYVKASNADAGDLFGFSVALSGEGNTMAVGARYEASSATGIGGNQADNGSNDSGAVYVFVRDGAGVWSQQAYVKASNTAAADDFGRSVALDDDGNILAVGAAGEDSSATGVGGNQASNTVSGSGAVYVFTRDGMGTWSQQAYVKASNTGSSDDFGTIVALSGDGRTLAVSARNEDSSATGTGGNPADNTVANSGAVYLY
jgi:hypothetical protein